MGCEHTLGRFIGMVCLSPFAFVGFLFGWVLVGCSGILLFSLASISGIFLDTIRWVTYSVTGEKTEDPKLRLQKAAKIIVQIWTIMADLKNDGELNAALLA